MKMRECLKNKLGLYWSKIWVDNHYEAHRLLGNTDPMDVLGMWNFWYACFLHFPINDGFIKLIPNFLNLSYHEKDSGHGFRNPLIYQNYFDHFSKPPSCV